MVTVPADEIPPMAIGAELGNYRIVRALDIDAGLSRSYLARHKVFEREVVVSQINYGFRTRERFGEWLRLMEQLRHPRIIGVLDCGESGGFPYAIVEYVEGRTLDQIITTGRRFDVLTALRLFLGLADGLAYCHEKGVAHHDIKPEHVIISADGVPFLKGFEGATPVNHPLRRGEGFCWTPDFAAPEIWDCARGLLEGTPDVAPRNFAVSDVWSFGLMMYRTLTGHDLVVGASLDEMRTLFCGAEPLPLPALQGVAPPVAEFIARCLRKQQAERYPDGAAASRALGAVLSHLEAGTNVATPVTVEVGRGLLVFTEPLGTSLSGRYLELCVTERLGGGGFSNVFRVERVLPEKSETAPMALKVLKGELLANGQALY